MNQVSLSNLNSSQLVIEASRYEDPKWWRGVWSLDDFDVLEKIAFCQRYWSVCFYISIIYLAFIYALRQWMKNRPALDLKFPLFLWNLCFTLFSIKGAWVMAGHVYSDVTNRGGHEFICGTADVTNKEAMYWTMLFSYSKVIQFGDTFFLLVRKKNVTFLHWYHHSSVFMGTSYSTKLMASSGTLAVQWNFAVHALIYGYLTLTTLGLKINRKIAMAITSSELSQFVAMLALMIYALSVHWKGLACTLQVGDIFIGFCAALIYLILFGNFFYSSYVKDKKPEKLN